MPFKGDRRLGGPHDNEGSLNGTHDEDNSVPAYGTVISSGNTREITITISETNETTSNGTLTYDIIADGSGGTLEDPKFTQYPSAGTQLGSAWGQSDASSTYEYDGNTYSYPNGKTNYTFAYADGLGSYWAEPATSGSFYSEGTAVVSAPMYSIQYSTTSHPDSYVNYDNGKYYYDTLVWGGPNSPVGEGQIYMSSGTPFTGGSFYSDGTYVSDANDTYVEVPSGSGNYYFDGNDNRWEWDGNGNIVFRYSGLYEYGTPIGDTGYFWTGTGGYY